MGPEFKPLGGFVEEVDHIEVSELVIREIERHQLDSILVAIG